MAGLSNSGTACGVCDKLVTNEAKVIICCACEKPYHQLPSCSGIPKAALSYALGMKMWICKSCELPCAKMFQGLSEVKARMDAVEDSIKAHDDRIKSLEEGQTSHNKDLIRELRYREEKKCNILIKGIPEEDNVDPNCRKESDSKTVQCLLGALDVQVGLSDVRFLYRLGKKDDAPDVRRPRAIMVGFKDVSTRDRVLQSSHRARDTTEFRNVYVDPDLTKAQIQDDAEMRREAKKRSESGNEEWRVKGIKGAGRLVRSKK